MTSHLLFHAWSGCDTTSATFLRYVKFLAMVSSSKAIDPQKLPPTERVAHFHNLWIHLQVMLWKKLTHEDLQLNPEQWDWKLDSTTTDMVAAPETLLKFV